MSLLGPFVHLDVAFLFLPSALLSTLFIWGLVPCAYRWGWLDRPDAYRKHHDGAVPLVGGPGMALALVFLVPWTQNAGPPGWPMIVTIVVVTTLVGAWDDRFELSAPSRLVMQLVLGVFIAYGCGVYVTHLGDLLGSGGSFPLGWFGPVFSVLAFAAAMNAFNMLDGIDGHSACHALITIGCVWVGSALTGGVAAPVAIALAGTLPAFLLFNFQRCDRGPLPKAFLGDSGALMLGALVAVVLISSAQRPHGWLEPVSTLWFAAIPLFDTTFVMLRRLLKGSSPLAAGRDHIHYLLRDHGFSARGALAVSVCAGLAFGLVGLLFEVFAVPATIRFVSLLGAFTGYVICASAMHRAFAAPPAGAGSGYASPVSAGQSEAGRAHAPVSPGTLVGRGSGATTLASGRVRIAGAALASARAPRLDKR